IVALAVDGDATFYAPLMEELFSPWVESPVEIEPMADLMILIPSFPFFGEHFISPSQALWGCILILSPWDWIGDPFSDSSSNYVKSTPSPGQVAPTIWRAAFCLLVMASA
ncbi:hypothetical protein HAX54_050641, partial [Datura stramonium]|nr:hypothetical protein [Datura stramonium]